MTVPAAISIGIFLCLVSVLIIGYFRLKSIHDRATADKRHIEERCNSIISNFENTRLELQHSKKQIFEESTKVAGLTSMTHLQERQITDLKNELIKKDLKIEELHAVLLRYQKTQAELQTQLDSQQAHANEKLTLVTEARDQLLREFKNLSHVIFEEKTKTFSEQNKTNLDLILNPLRDQIGEFKKKVEDIYVNESKDRHALSEHIKILTNLNQQVSKETENLTRALKGENKVQGNWGEMILERALELSGLKKGSEYDIQVAALDDEGKRQLPDVVVHLPEGRDIIIDSKVTLIAYQGFVNADNDHTKEKFLDAHLTSVKNHIDQLSIKSYDKLSRFHSLDYVLMFMPIEAAFLAALHTDPHLFEYAYHKHIILVSPATLLVTLRTIQNMWQIEYQNRNTQEIVRKAADLYDKFVSFVTTLSEVKKAICQASEKCDGAISLLSTGRGNLIRRVEDFKIMGVKPKKSLPIPLIEQDSEKENDTLIDMAQSETNSITTL